MNSVTRKYLTTNEVDTIMLAAMKKNRHGQRDATMILLAFRHGLRASEVVGLRWADVDLELGHIFVKRSKGSVPGTHPLRGEELRALRKLKREQKGTYVFVSERKAPLTVDGYRKMIKRTGIKAGLSEAHSHMLRHACGFKLANDGVDTRTIQQYMGHRNIQHTVVYTELAPGRFNDLWRD